ncbi:MAG: hypothetical protein UT24_C0005G0036 [Candidatus Woesebacteria bacterium GW2011_GWB1_39_12]|uniref:DUF5655 domain-containing protein n=2 Tax=Candidatus Woeseibacteriota TaxID=1752722 RepID=A0A0G0M3Y0_9BACT|nr:MAG: hypothetical protein UT23_C0006G0058 [Candidatus Woesebacteria bacterium GW2011_GWA1_39_12]KKR01327.1 MAG: hypothetical protein UT24_C0005G0036 [Candidatus Woesebacteria bacterium GW2011_GWB1_39_12]
MTVKINKQSSYPLDYHFRGERVNMKPLFDDLTTKLVKEIDFEYKIGKAYIGLIHTLVFAALRIQTSKIIVEFVARKQFKSPRINKVKHFQKQRWAYFVDIKESKDIDKGLIDWIKQSYE